jgi:uncharacterized membrane protein
MTRWRLLASAVPFLFPSAIASAQPLDPVFSEIELLAHECSDGIDNDDERRLDFPEDPDCVDAEDEAERRPSRGPRAHFRALRLPRGVDEASVSDVSEHGRTIVGAILAPNPWHPALALGSLVWRSGHPRVLNDVRPFLPEWAQSGATGVSDGGRIIVGFEQTPKIRGQVIGYRWERGELIRFGTEPSWGQTAVPFDVSDTGILVGFFNVRPALWDDGELRLLDPRYQPGRHGGHGFAFAITPDGGTIVGSFGYGAPPTPLFPSGTIEIATAWRDGEVEGIPLFPPSDPRFLEAESSQALDVSDDGNVIVGTITLAATEDADEEILAFRKRGNELRFFAHDVRNDIEQAPMTLTRITGDGSLAVGWAQGVGPIVVDGSRPRSLVDLLENEYGVDLRGWDLTRAANKAASISPDGRIIVGNGTSPDGRYAPWWVRLPPPCADGLDNDGDGAVDLREGRSCRARHDRSEKD